MAKTRSPMMDYAAYLGLRIGVCLLQIIPPDLALRFVEFIISLVYRFNRRHREVCIDNLRHAFPGQYSDAELHAMAFRVYRHFALILLEVFLMPRKLTASTWRQWVNWDESSHLHEVVDAGRPVIVLTAHFGNWELAGHCLGLAGIPSHVVARPLDNPYVDRWLRSFREGTGNEVLSKSGDIRRMTEVLNDGETLVTLGDQDAGPNGMFVEFFGRLASTHKAIARLAQRTGAVILVGAAVRTGGLLEYTMRFIEIIDPNDYDGRADDTFAITQRFTDAIEKMIRIDPTQYFWLHRRWKHQPTALPKKAAA